jgi:undecaprenyl diphosphate synthase
MAIEPDPAKLPAHVAVIMDGNGRWAKQRLLNRIKGHEKGAEAVRTIVRTCRRIGIPYLTLYAFSTENWQRPAHEIAALMALLRKFLRDERQEMLTNGIRLNAIGQIARLPDDVRADLQSTMDLTRHQSRLCLTLALSYGGRTEILEMVRAVARAAAAGKVDPEALGEAELAAGLYTADLPDPDLLIRTSGEMRVSNFLLWQIAYTELFVTDTLWPDFTAEEFLSIINHYQARERRFGKVAE